MIQSRRFLAFAAATLVALLLVKYFWSLALFPGVPFGYDAGIYRYLFLKHAEAFPPVMMTALPPWAASHPLGLFFFSTLALRLGIPVDWLIGWIWNLFPVVLAATLARVTAKRSTPLMGLCVLLVCLLSPVQYQGFLMIYWKVFVALLWCVLSFDAFDRGQKRWIIYGMFVVATHQQIGLVFLLATLSSVITLPQKIPRLRMLGEWLAAMLLGLLWYIPNARYAFGDILPLLATPTALFAFLGVLVIGIGTVTAAVRFPVSRKPIFVLVCIAVAAGALLLPLTGTAPEFLDKMLLKLAQGEQNPGAFFTVPEYLQASLPLLLLGVAGFLLSLRKQRGTPAQWAAVWCALAVVSMFFFYRRFLLPLDFFLLPFAALALHEAWLQWRKSVMALALAAVLAQSWLTTDQIRQIDPHVERSMLISFTVLPSVVHPGSRVIVLDTMAPWVVGFLPENNVSGPGIFDSLPLESWQAFFYGSTAERQRFISNYPAGTYFLATDVFRSFYPPQVQTLLMDPCFRPTLFPGLLVSVCGPSAAVQP